MGHIDFLLSFVKNQEAEIEGKQQVIGELIIAAKGWEDKAAHERVWCEACRRAHPVPQNADHRKELQCVGVWYFADSSRKHGAREIAENIAAKWPEYANPVEALEAVIDNEQESAATSMRSACVEEMRRSLHDPSLRFSDDGIKAAITDWTNILMKRLESVSIQEQEAKQ